MKTLHFLSANTKENKLSIPSTILHGVCTIIPKHASETTAAIYSASTECHALLHSHLLLHNVKITRR
jgi:hypothetical protein